MFGAGTFYILRLMATRRDIDEPDIEKGVPMRAAGITPASALEAADAAAAREGGYVMLDLAFIWAGLIAFAVLAYVLFDGFDLGVGILFPVPRRRGRQRAATRP